MKFGDPIDLAALKTAADGEGPTACVERAWLARVHEELTAARAASTMLGRVFGRPGEHP